MLIKDVIIIGAGAVGCALAKVFSEYRMNVCVIEKEADVAFGTSGRNSGVVHAGFNNKPGSFKAKFCVEGSRGFENLAEELGIEYKKTGKLVTGFSDDDRKKLEELKKRGEINGVEGLEIIDGNRIKDICGSVKGNFALWSPQTAVFDPFEYTIALAETAAANGTGFVFNERVIEIKVTDSGRFKVMTENNSFESDILINCAGLGSAEICKMLGVNRYDINPCRGEYHILAKPGKNNDIGEPKIPVYPVPDEKKGVLGVHLTPTVGGNLMAGPGAEFIEDKDDYANEEDMMKLLSEGMVRLIPDLQNVPVIRSFSGIRPKLTDSKNEIIEDFVIEKSEEYEGFYYLVGIESPGITASMPIAKYLFDRIEKDFGESFEKKKNCKSRKDMFSRREYKGLRKMVCRCEGVTEERILRAFDDIVLLGAEPTIKGIKNRTRAFMGSCQGCFCTIDTTELLGRERNVSPDRLTYSGKGSEMFEGILK